MTKSMCYIFGAFVLLGSSCYIPPVPSVPTQRTVFSIQLDSLMAVDLSENKSRISTQEDEIVLFTFLSNGSTIKQYRPSELLLFQRNGEIHNISTSITDFVKTDYLSFFLIELDEEQLSSQLGEHCADAVQMPGFPQRFDHQLLDSLLGHDDLLGMRSIPVTDCFGKVEITFRGRQLFDPFMYHLYLNGE